MAPKKFLYVIYAWKTSPIAALRIAERHSDGINLLHNKATISTILSYIIFLRSSFVQTISRSAAVLFSRFIIDFAASWTLDMTNKKFEAQNRKSFEVNSPGDVADMHYAFADITLIQLTIMLD